MPAATTKAELRATTEKEFLKLTKVLDGVSDTLRHTSHEQTTIKDVVGHRAHWTMLFLGWYKDGQAEKTVHFPAEGYR